MFSEELKDATEARKLKAVKKRKNAMKPKKKAEGGLVENFGGGGWVTKQLKKGAGKAAEATGKAADAAKKKAKKELAKIKRNKNIKNKTITKPGPVTKSSDFDTGSSKHMPLMKKQEDVVKKYKLAKGGKVKKYAHGGPVRKSIDGIAQRGLTRANHK